MIYRGRPRDKVLNCSKNYSNLRVIIAELKTKTTIKPIPRIFRENFLGFVANCNLQYLTLSTVNSSYRVKFLFKCVCALHCNAVVSNILFIKPLMDIQPKFQFTNCTTFTRGVIIKNYMCEFNGRLA